MLLLEEPLHLGDLLARGPAGGQGGDGGLEQPPRLEQLLDGLAVGRMTSASDSIRLSTDTSRTN